MERLGAQEGEVITHALVTRSIGSAQRRVELQNFEARKRLLEYDDVMNQQREVIYDMRLFALEGGADLKGEVWEMIDAAARSIVPEYAPEDAHVEEWDLAALRARIAMDYFLIVEELPQDNAAEHEYATPADVEELIVQKVRDGYKRKLEGFGELQEQILSWVLLHVIDEKWRDHLYDLDHLKASIGFRSYGQKDPLIEYKQEAYTMFVDLMTDIRKTVASLTFKSQLQVPQPRPTLPQRIMLSGPTDTPDTRPMRGLPPPEPLDEMDEDELTQAITGRGPPRPTPRGLDPRITTNRGDDGQPPPQKPASSEPKIGRNDPCPCGSGKKYKKCHGLGAA
jgi:preprotein translocase subunit SecA